MIYRRSEMLSGWALALGLVLLLLLAIYAITMFELYQHQKGPFAPYHRPELDKAFRPLGAVTILTPEQRYRRCVSILGASDPSCHRS